MGCNVSKDVKVEDQGNATKGEMSEEKAAEKIQASFRGYQTRKILKDNGVLPAKENESNGEVTEKTEELPEQTEEKSSAIPAQTTDEEDIANIDLTDVELEKAAAKIQASYRNFSAAKKKQQEPTPSPPPEKDTEEDEDDAETAENDAKDDEENLEDIDLGDPEVEKAALKIQSTFRGYKVRKEVKTEETEEVLTNGEKGEDE